MTLSAGAWTVQVARAVARRTWRKTFRRPTLLTFSLVQPLVWMTFFGFLFQRYQLDSLPTDLTYLDFLVPGVCAMTVLFGASQSGIGWIRDLQTGFLPRMLSTPAHPGALLAGKVAADVVRLLVQAALVLLAALLLGAHFAPAAAPVLVALLCLTAFAAGFSFLSCAIALTARAQEAMATFVHLVNMPLLFTSTALVPAKQMPSWLGAVAAYNPLSLTVDALRGALLFAEMPTLGNHVLPLLGFAIIPALVAERTMRKLGKLY